MKKNIHPAYNVVDVKMTNGETIQIRSTMKRPEGMQLDIDPLTHPAWTGGNQRLLDTGGRVSRFKEKFKGFGF